MKRHQRVEFGLRNRQFEHAIHVIGVFQLAEQVAQEAVVLRAAVERGLSRCRPVGVKRRPRSWTASSGYARVSHSNLSEAEGSIRQALRIGRTVATIVTLSTTTSADVRINGSDAWTSYNQLATSRPAP